MSLGNAIDNLVKKRDKIRAMQQEVDALRSEYEIDSQAVMEEMAGMKIDKATGSLGTVSLKETTVAHVLDWDKVYNFILRHKKFELMQRRIADGAYRELLEIRQGKQVPGIEPFNKKGINLRKLG